MTLPDGDRADCAKGCPEKTLPVARAGASEEALALADAAVTVPMATCFVDSLNVSVAAALILAEARRQRVAALGR